MVICVRKQLDGTMRTRGFSLLELLLVVAIILIIATIAIPALLRSKQSADESAAVANLRNVGTAEATYILSSGGNYGTLADLITAVIRGDTDWRSYILDHASKAPPKQGR